MGPSDLLDTHALWAHLVPARPFLVPELELHLLPPSSPAWRRTDPEVLGWPYWAFAWPGGQALARHLLDHPELVLGRSVLAFGAGGGVEALAAARAGATLVTCADVDPLACEVASRNAALNHLSVQCTTEDLLGRPVDAAVLLVGDACYEPALAERVLAWIADAALAGVTVLLGDPGRVGRPFDLHRVATYLAPADGAPDGSSCWPTHVFEASRSSPHADEARRA